MIRITGNFTLDPDLPALYPNAVIDVRPILAPDFSSLSAEVLVYFEVDDGAGGTMLKHAATRYFSLTSGDMATDEPTIAQVLGKLKQAVLKTLRREFQPYNQGVSFTII